MPSPDTETVTPAVKAAVEAAVERKFVSRDEWLNQAGILKEEEHYVDGFGYLLLSEVTGDVRADIVSSQSQGLLADKKSIDAKQYQRQLIMAGVVDPSSPEGARLPMFRPGDMDRVMKLGGSKIAEIVDVIEKLSSLGQYGGAAEGNSEITPNGASTS
jgi:hypothetical protein